MCYETVQLVQKFKEDIHIQGGVHTSLHLQKTEKQTKHAILTLLSTDRGRQEIYIYSLGVSSLRKCDVTIILE